MNYCAHTLDKLFYLIGTDVESVCANVDNKINDKDIEAQAQVLLKMKNGAVIDIGGGTTGISIFKDGKVVYIADEPTGGTHFSLVLAGAYGKTFEDAEVYKRDEKNHRELLPVLKPVIEKVSSIISNHIEGYDVEEFATGYVVMENGAVIYLESSWALNTTDVAGVRYMICGDKAGVDNYNGKFKINGICNDKQYVIYPDLAPAGVAFTERQGAYTQYQEQRVFLDAIRGNGELVTKPEAAAVVVQILDGIYKSARSGEPYYFDKD